MKIIFHPVSLIVIALSVWFGLALYMFVCMLAVLIHEFGHAIMARRYGVRASRITLLPFGAAVSLDCALLPKRSQAMILLSGSFANMVASVVAGSFLWTTPQFFDVLGIFIVANTVIAVMNLLPFYPLDGGKIVELCGRKWVVMGMRFLSNIVFSAMFLVSFFVLQNWSFVIFSLCMVYTVNTRAESTYVATLKEMLKHAR